MPQRTIAVAALLGLHARPATLFVQAAKDTGLPVTIAREGQEPVEATSVLAVMALGYSLVRKLRKVERRGQQLESAGEQPSDTDGPQPR